MVAGVSNCSRHGCGRVLNSSHTGFVACVLAFTACTMVQEAAAQGSVATDRAALAALYESTGGADWRDRTNWLSDEPIGDWYGVETDASGRVSGLGLADNGLTGTLPPEIGNLSHRTEASRGSEDCGRCVRCRALEAGEQVVRAQASAFAAPVAEEAGRP